MFTCALIAVGWASGPGAAAEKSTQTAATAPIAVVELFTSEKCPSCPAADAYLGELASSARRSGEQIFPLAFHVDYWSAPGSEDPLSSQLYVERQKDYARAMGLESCYTPQMIVNGTSEFVGSRRETGQEKINSALERPASIAVKVAARSAETAATNAVAVEYEVSSAPENSVINLAMVDNGGSSQSGSSEHANVVRAFRTISLKTSGKHKVELKAPSASLARNCLIIAYVQNSRTRAVLGAARAELRGEATGQALLQERD
jgi:hypothetical protein